MARIMLNGSPIHTKGELPAVGFYAPNFSLVMPNLDEIKLTDLIGKFVILNIFPGIDTPVCSASVIKFNSMLENMEDTVAVNISLDLPFTQSRFSEAEGLNRVIMASAFRSPEFSEKYGIKIIDGPIKGLLSRAIIVINKEGKVIYTEQVPDITIEPDYKQAIESINL